MKKIDAQNIHAVRRAKERYGIDITVLDLKQMAAKIRKGNAVFISKSPTTNRVTMHLVECAGVQIVVAYDKRRNSVCSILSKNSREYKSARKRGLIA